MRTTRQNPDHQHGPFPDMRERRCPYRGGLHAFDAPFCPPHVELGQGEHEGTLEIPLPDGTLMRCPVPDNIICTGVRSLRPGRRCRASRNRDFIVMRGSK